MPPILLENPRRGLLGLLLAILLCLVLSQSLLPTPARAQAPTGQPQQGQPSGAMSKEEQLLADLRERTLAAINHTMTAFNTGIGVFNTQIGIINEARPLDPANLDSATIAANVSRTLAFVSYLDGYVRANDSLARSLEDSVEVMEIVLFCPLTGLPRN